MAKQKGAAHQKTCPKCLGRDYLAIALDLTQLW
jgi:hypothetical protein